jgi:YihY family inner membrane protein
VELLFSTKIHMGQDMQYGSNEGTGLIKELLRRIDSLQQRHVTSAFIFGVIKKFGDDQCGTLAALLAYYGLLSVFPLLLLLFTLLGIFFGHDVALQQRIIHSALAQFPVVGQQLAKPGGISSLRTNSVARLTIGVLWLLWGSLGVTQAGQRAMADVWNVPQVERPNFVARLGRSLGFLGVLFLDVVISTFLAGVVTISGVHIVAQVLAILAGLIVNIPLFMLGFRLLTPRSIATRSLVSGAVAGAVGWSLLQYGGTWLVGHQLRHASQLYGYFASIIGLVSFLYLAAQITLYAAEFNVVRVRRLYPRSIVQPPLTPADEAVLTAIALESQRRPEQLIVVQFHADADAASSGDVPTDLSDDDASAT